MRACCTATVTVRVSKGPRLLGRLQSPETQSGIRGGIGTEICMTTTEICMTTAEICMTTTEICMTTTEICMTIDVHPSRYGHLYDYGRGSQRMSLCLSTRMLTGASFNRFRGGN